MQATRQASPKTSTHSTQPRIPTPEGNDDDGPLVWFALGSIALLGTYFAASWAGAWAAQVGQSWVDIILGGDLGGGGGGGEPPCKNLPAWICSAADFDAFGWGANMPEGPAAAIMLLIFLGFIAFWIYLLMRLPIIPTWQNHVALSKVLKPSTFVVFFVVAVTNSELTTALERMLITPRTWTAFAAALVGFSYIGLTTLLAPRQLAAISADDPELPELNRKRAPARYLLSLLAIVFLLNTAFVAFTLLPNALVAAPPGYDWWCVLWPFGCDL